MVISQGLPVQVEHAVFAVNLSTLQFLLRTKTLGMQIKGDLYSLVSKRRCSVFRDMSLWNERYEQPREPFFRKKKRALLTSMHFPRLTYKIRCGEAA